MVGYGLIQFGATAYCIGGKRPPLSGQFRKRSLFIGNVSVQIGKLEAYLTNAFELLKLGIDFFLDVEEACSRFHPICFRHFCRSRIFCLFSCWCFSFIVTSLLFFFLLFVFISFFFLFFFFFFFSFFLFFFFFFFF